MEFRLELSLNKKKGFNFGAMGSSGMLRAVLLLFSRELTKLACESTNNSSQFQDG